MALLVASSVVVVGCAPTRTEMVGPVEAAVAARSGRHVRWRGADPDKDRAVDDAVTRLLAAPLDLDSVAEIALVRHPAVQVAFAGLGIAQADLVDAGLLQNPRLALGTRVVQQHDDNYPSGVDVDVEIETPLLSLVFLAQRMSIAEARRDAERSRVIEVALRTAADARAAFVRAVAAVQLHRLALADAEAAELAVVFVRSNTAAGNMNALDLALEEARYQQAVLAAADAERDERVQREALAAALGLWGKDVVVRLPDALPAPALVDSADLEATALRHNATLAARRAALDAEARALGYASAARFLPDLDVGAGVEVDHHGETALGPQVGVGLPVFNLGQGEMLRRESALGERAAELARDAILLRARARQAAVVVDNAARRVRHIEERVLPPLRAVVDEVERRLNGMSVVPTHLVLARRAEIAAHKSYVEAVRDAWLARIDVELLEQGGTPAAPTLPVSSPSTSVPEGGH